MIEGINPGGMTPEIQKLLSETAAVNPQDPKFEDMLMKLIEDVDAKQKVADDSIKALATGSEDVSIQEVVMKMEEADMTFRLMKEIRDKLVEAYKEIMSMQS